MQNQQSFQINVNHLAKQILNDQFIQHWHSQLQQSSEGKNYMAFKGTVSFETYFNKLPRSQYLKIYKMRTTNH